MHRASPSGAALYFARVFDANLHAHKSTLQQIASCVMPHYDG
jgi:hypothetical protein